VGREWQAKPVGFVCYRGLSGGLRAVEQLHIVLAELQTVTIREMVSFHGARERFDEHGVLREPDAVNAAAGTLLDQLAWWAHTLRHAQLRDGVVGADAVLSALGGRAMSRTTTVYSAGTAAALAAMCDTGVRRFTVFRPPRLTDRAFTGRYRTAVDDPLHHQRSGSMSLLLCTEPAALALIGGGGGARMIAALDRRGDQGKRAALTESDP
jgi:NADPH-dependent FMN reductase